MKKRILSLLLVLLMVVSLVPTAAMAEETADMTYEVTDGLIYLKQYTKQNLPSEFNDENITSANYSLDILKRLYENQEKYQTLIELMKKSSGGGYLKKNITTCEIAHKYGSYEGNIHDYGICYAKQKYLIGIFTKKVPDAENLIANINKEILETQK